MDGLIDSSIIIDIYRGYSPAVTWFSANNSKVFGVSTIVWMELVDSAPNKVMQQKIIQLLSMFQTVHLTPEDELWAMGQFAKFKLSHNMDLTDALIAAPVHRLKFPFYTRNPQYFLLMIPALVQQPY